MIRIRNIDDFTEGCRRAFSRLLVVLVLFHRRSYIYRLLLCSSHAFGIGTSVSGFGVGLSALVVTIGCTMRHSNSSMHPTMTTTTVRKVQLEKSSKENCDKNCDKNYLTDNFLPGEVVVRIALYLHPKTLTKLACVNRGAREMIDGISTKENGDQRTSSLVWTALWQRDYGNALLGWDVGRDAIRRSLGGEIADKDLPSTLSSHLDARSRSFFSEAFSLRHPAKELYFSTSSQWLDYAMAGLNLSSRCLLGMHGHAFDFTPFQEAHPGLSGPILMECGKDATDYFEDVRHSAGARRIAEKLCLMIDRSKLPGGGVGLVPCGDENIRQMISLSNTRPPKINSQFLPSGPIPNTLKTLVCHARTLQSGRQNANLQAWKLTAKIDQTNYMSNYLRLGMGSSAQHWTNSPTTLSKVRVYYDPIVSRWKGWYNICDTDDDMYNVYCELSPTS